MTTPAVHPLRDLHHAADAEWASWDGIDIVATFGEPQAEYAVSRKSAGLIDLPQCGLIELTGKDRHAFLNNLLTNQTWSKVDKTGLTAGQGVYAFLLNLRGRIVCDITVLELGERTWLEVDRRLVPELLKLFDAYLFTEQVKLIDRSNDFCQFALHGPRALDLLNQVADTPIDLPTLLGSANRRLFNFDVTIYRDDPLGLPGYHILSPIGNAAATWAGLIERFGREQTLGKRNLRPLGWAMFNTLRIEAGRPIFGIDFAGQPVQTAYPTKANREQAGEAAGGVLPAETSLMDRAVSFTKGCYLGQEIVARMAARSQVARKIVGVRLDGDALPIAGEGVFDARGNQVGVITSSTNSPVLSNRAICLAFVKSAVAAPGTAVTLPAEGSMRQAVVVQLPFVGGVL